MRKCILWAKWTTKGPLDIYNYICICIPSWFVEECGITVLHLMLLWLRSCECFLECSSEEYFNKWRWSFVLYVCWETLHWMFCCNLVQLFWSCCLLGRCSHYPRTAGGKCGSAEAFSVVCKVCVHVLWFIQHWQFPGMLLLQNGIWKWMIKSQSESQFHENKTKQQQNTLQYVFLFYLVIKELSACKFYIHVSVFVC